MTSKMYLDQPGRYRILVQGALDAHWAEYFEGMRIEIEISSNGIPRTSLIGCLEDQAAVQGTLQKLYNLGYPLISVQVLPEEPP